MMPVRDCGRCRRWSELEVLQGEQQGENAPGLPWKEAERFLQKNSVWEEIQNEGARLWLCR
jgi:hypothetical protein